MLYKLQKFLQGKHVIYKSIPIFSLKVMVNYDIIVCKDLKKNINFAQLESLLDNKSVKNRILFQIQWWIVNVEIVPPIQHSINFPEKGETKQ